jgi:uncharacterized protein YodC (DUF2158 family)
MKLKEGDVVQLKSGGPKMTVFSRNDRYKTVEAEWFDKNHEYHEETFCVECLVRCGEEETANPSDVIKGVCYL